MINEIYMKCATTGIVLALFSEIRSVVAVRRVNGSSKRNDSSKSEHPL